MATIGGSVMNKSIEPLITPKQKTVGQMYHASYILDKIHGDIGNCAKIKL